MRPLVIAILNHICLLSAKGRADSLLTQASIRNLKAPSWSLPAIAHCYSNHYSILS
ncbi:hypothetical protein llh_6740 [Lactococcus cremoris subsp. cremoris A76]|nr:hypothetical protein llh_6740 [Lactococcus cremoris subsp. cremoris A76]